MICVVNTFDRQPRIVSRHRSARAAYRAEQKLQRDTKRSNGQSSYIPTEFWQESGDKQTKIDIYELLREEGVAGDEL